MIRVVKMSRCLIGVAAFVCVGLLAPRTIAARIVHGPGAWLEYQTAPGFGATFSIVLPLAVGDPP